MIYREIKIFYMKNLIPYEAINEAETALPTIPAFLKTAGAKPQHVQYGGPRNPNQPPNAWILEIPSPVGGNDTWRIDFFPDGTFSTAIQPKGDTSFPFRSGGKWKADSASNFMVGKKTIKGVAMNFTALMAPTTLM